MRILLECKELYGLILLIKIKRFFLKMLMLYQNHLLYILVELIRLVKFQQFLEVM